MKKHHTDHKTPATDLAKPMAREISKDGARCRVTFRLPKEAAPDATIVTVAGSFNGWSLETHPMVRSEDGDFRLEVDLEAGKEFEFRFVIDGVRWVNAWNADKYAWSDFAQCENSVVTT